MINGLAKRLTEQRLMSNRSIKEVATSVGVSPSTLSNYEHGYRVPSLEKLVSLAMYYHCTTDYLLGVTQEGQQLLDTGKLSTQQLSLLNTFLQSL